MFKNPLKYQSGGVTQSKEQEAENQLVSAIAEGLGAQPEQVKARLEQIKSNPDEVKELQSALQLMQQDQNAGFQAVLKLFAKPQSAKHGAKIQDFICKHKRGGYVAGCGCKEDGGIVKGQEGIPSINGYRVFPRTWQNNSDGSTSSEQIAVEPNGQAIQRVIIDRSRMTNRDGLPIRDTLRLGGYYTPDGFIQDGDITFGREIDPIFDTVNKKKVVKNQEPAGPMPEPDDSYFGTISEDTTNPIRRWIDNKINNNPTLYRTRQGLRNFAQSAPGKVLDFFVPDVTSENGVMSAVAPVVSKIRYRIPTEASINQRGRALIKAESDRLKAIEAATKEGRYYVEPKPSDYDIDKSYIFNSPNYTGILSKIRNIKITK